MKLFKFFPLLVLLTGCGTADQEIYQQPLVLDYPEESQIVWEDVLKQEDELYYVYFYSLTCGYCANLKAQMLEYNQTTTNVLYFCNVTDGFMYKENVNSVIGCNEISEFGIVGIPSLIEITKNTVSNYFLGISAITVFIENK